MSDAPGNKRTGEKGRPKGTVSPAGDIPAKFVTGSTMRHVIVMTSTGSAGLMAIFAVDFLNLFYISLLGEKELAAAIGYAGAVMAFSIAISVGLTIATGALISRALGAGERERARRMATSALIFMFVVACVFVLLLWPAIPLALELLGATGQTAEIATGFLRIVVPSLLFMALGMGLAAVLRAVGDARRGMYITLAGGLASAIFDPLFIFGLDLGVTGAAIATVLSRMVLVIVGWHGAHRVHRMLGRFEPKMFLSDMRSLSGIAVPAVLTNIATPVGNAYVTGALSGFGDDAVAGWAIIGRIIPLAFGTLFALSGAVGPIIGQNFGARQVDRVRAALRDALYFALGCTAAAWLALVVLQGTIISIFGANDQAATMIRFFCLFVAGSFVFTGALYVANAAFNNLGFPTYSTLFNWGRATLGTIPLVWIGGNIAGPIGAMAGWAIGGIVFGVAAAIVAFRLTARIRPDDHRPGESDPEATALLRTEISPLSSGKHTLS